jgi:hypothetical protein
MINSIVMPTDERDSTSKKAIIKSKHQLAIMNKRQYILESTEAKSLQHCHTTETPFVDTYYSMYNTIVVYHLPVELLPV